MKYLLLCHMDGSKMAKQTKADWAALDDRSRAYDAELQAAGHYIMAEALADPEQAVIVRPDGDAFSTTDGPFVETKEHLGGFILVEARDLNEAIAIAAKIPVGAFGAIEVRPIMDY